MKMDEIKRTIQYVNRAEQLDTDINAMEVDVHNQELATKILCNLPSKFEHLIVATDAVADG